MKPSERILNQATSMHATHEQFQKNEIMFGVILNYLDEQYEASHAQDTTENSDAQSTTRCGICQEVYYVKYVTGVGTEFSSLHYRRLKSKFCPECGHKIETKEKS